MEYILLRSDSYTDERGFQIETEFYGYIDDEGNEVVKSTFTQEIDPSISTNIEEEISYEELQLARDEIMLDMMLTLEEIKLNQEMQMVGGTL